MVQNKTNLEFAILLHLARETTHLRELARATHTPHSTILRRLDRLVKENVLDCETVGKNKVFSIKKNLQAKTHLEMAERYKLAKLIEKYPKLGLILQDLLSSIKSPLIILFGSYAKSIAKEDSDIDIFIETEDNAVKRRAETLNSKLSVKIGPFDTKSPLINEIIKNHVIIRGVDDFYEKTRFFA